MDGQLPMYVGELGDRPRPSKAPRLDGQQQQQQGAAAIAAVARPSVSPRVDEQAEAAPRQAAPAAAPASQAASWGDCPVEHRTRGLPKRLFISCLYVPS